MMTLEEFAGKIRESCEIVVFTGAGISTESGIPDFRSPGGIWTRYRPVTYQEFVASEAARIEAWKRRLETHEAHKNAKPNIGHYFVQSLDAKGKLIGLITQNVDGLHNLAGLPDEKSGAPWLEPKDCLFELRQVLRPRPDHQKTRRRFFFSQM